jgi:quercetin dioxygenase-like cupin family protein
MDDTNGLVVVAGAGGQVLSPVGGSITHKVRGEHSGGQIAIFESAIPPGEGPPLHVHAGEAEVLYVLDGTFRFQLRDEVTAAPAGSLMFVPRGVAHTWQNAGDAPGRLLVTFTPAGMERFFDRAEGDRAAFESFGEELGMTVVGPPLRD